MGLLIQVGSLCLLIKSCSNFKKKKGILFGGQLFFADNGCLLFKMYSIACFKFRMFNDESVLGTFFFFYVISISHITCEW